MDMYLYKFHSYNPKDIIKKCSDIVNINQRFQKFIATGIKVFRNVYLNGSFKEYFNIHYEGIKKKAFMNQVRFYATNEFPSILKITGYSINKKERDLYFDNKIIGSLAEVIKKNKKHLLDPTNKLIIAYGIANALKYLHNHQIVHNNLNTSNILLDNTLLPYLSEFHYAELVNNDSHENKNKFSSEAFEFGLILFILITETDPFTGLKPQEILKKINEVSSSSFPENTNIKWIELIINCWSLDMRERPSFSQICEQLDSDQFIDQYISVKDFRKYKMNFIQSKGEINHKLIRKNAVSDIALCQDVEDMKNVSYIIREPRITKKIKVKIDNDLITDITQDF